MDWRPTETIIFWSSLLYRQESYDDLGNQRPLDDSLRADAGIRFSLTEEQSLSLQVENLFDTQVQTGLSSAGLLSVGAPRTLWLSWEYSR